MPNQSDDRSGGGFLSKTLTVLKTIASATFGLPLALATTLTVGIVVAALNIVNFSSTMAQKMFLGNNPDKDLLIPSKDLLIPISNSAAFGVVKSSWNLFLFPYKRLSALITNSSSQLHEQFAPYQDPGRIDVSDAVPKNYSKKHINWLDDDNLYNLYNPSVNQPSNHPSAPNATPLDARESTNWERD